RTRHSLSGGGQVRSHGRPEGLHYDDFFIGSAGLALFDLQQLHVEHEGRVRWNRCARAPRAVAEIRRNDERARATDLHAGDPLIPPADHHAGAKPEAERLAAIEGAVELLAMAVRRLAVVQPTGVMDGDVLPGLRVGARPDLGVRYLQARDVVHKRMIVLAAAD